MIGPSPSVDETGATTLIAVKLGNDPDQNLVSPDVGMTLEEE